MAGHPPERMSPAQRTPEQLAQQLVEESAALLQADLDLKAAHQRGDELLRQFQTKMEINRHDEQRVTLALVALAGITGGVLYLLYPEWLPKQIATLSSLIKHL